MDYYAHTMQDKNGNVKDVIYWQPLSEHLKNTADLSEGFAIDGLKGSARLMGLLHDIGKYQPSFQKRLQGANIQVDHAVCGAKEAEKLSLQYKLFNYIFAYGVAGHHSGLPDKGNMGENDDESSLRARLKKQTEDYSAFRGEIEIDAAEANKELMDFFQRDGGSDAYEFLTRYLFSCLTDADFLDTERFCQGAERERYTPDWTDCAKRLEEKFSSFKAETTLQKARAALKNQALGNITENSPVYLLDMPTGSGKTLCSVALALERVRLTNKKRIIYVIPYTSIIEQTADTMQKLFPSLTILQHHCNFDFDAEDDGKSINYGEASALEKLKKSTENWDVPIVITTNVQFFESIYSNRGSRLRKLHNMADSVIIFDEVHTLPINYFIPCIKAVEQLTTHYNSEALFLTATMPDFAALCSNYIGHQLKIKDLLPDKSLYGVFDKCVFEDVGDTDVVDRIDEGVSTLVICNRKKTAEDMYNHYNGHKYYLSTYLTPRDRSKIISDIRADLADGKKPAVFSTSLIEAGVDLDFECVWREIAGVDNILQAAGRCNREGLRGKQTSKVYIFKSGEERGEIGVKANVTKGLIEKYGAQNIASLQCIKEYFTIIYAAEEHKMKKSSDSFDINFKSIAEDFKLIDSASVGIVIPREENAAEITALREGHGNRRKLQKDSAAVSVYELKQLLSAGVIENIGGVFVLAEASLYNDETGINTSPETGAAIEF